MSNNVESVSISDYAIQVVKLMCKIELEVKQLQEFIDIVGRASNSDKVKHSEVAELVYKLDDDKVELLQCNLDKLGEEQAKNPNDAVFVVAMIDSIQLCLSQRNYLSKGLKHSEMKAEKVETDIAKSKETLDAFTEKTDQAFKTLEVTKSSIYTDFISILGIFTAICFAVFGGITALGSVFSHLDLGAKHGLSNVIITASVCFLLIYEISVTLLIGVTKVSNKGNKYQFNRIFTSVCIGVPTVLILLTLYIDKFVVK